MRVWSRDIPGWLRLVSSLLEYGMEPYQSEVDKAWLFRMTSGILWRSTMGDAAEPGEMEQTGTGTNTGYCNGKFPQIDIVAIKQWIVLIVLEYLPGTRHWVGSHLHKGVVSRYDSMIYRRLLLFVWRNVAFPSHSRPRFNVTAQGSQAPQRTDTESSPNETRAQQELAQNGKTEMIKRKEKSPTRPYEDYGESQCDVACDLSFLQP